MSVDAYHCDLFRCGSVCPVLNFQFARGIAEICRALLFLSVNRTDKINAHGTAGSCNLLACGMLMALQFVG